MVEDDVALEAVPASWLLGVELVSEALQHWQGKQMTVRFLSSVISATNCEIVLVVRAVRIGDCGQA